MDKPDSEAVELTRQLNLQLGLHPESDGYMPAPIVFSMPRRMVEASTLTDEWLVKELLERCIPDWDGEDDHSANTPARFVRTLKELGDRDSEVFTFTTFEATSDEMIVLGPIPFYTLCAHHVVPFHGNVYVGYVPDLVIAGLSKFARTVKYISKGLWVQEDLTAAIHDFLEDKLRPNGMAVQLRAEHMCMSMRGVQMPGVITTTNKMSGVFADHARTAKAEFMEGIRNGK